MNVQWRTIVLGGVRSGKSTWAEQQLAGSDDVDYVATAAPVDDEDFPARIAQHQQRRPGHWQTVETLDLTGILTGSNKPLLIDDLGNWVARTIDASLGWDGDLSGFRAETDLLVAAWEQCRGRAVLVSNEVGSGVHPGARSGRIFRDELGRLNALLAAPAEEVVLLTAGIPQWLRRPGARSGETA